MMKALHQGPQELLSWRKKNEGVPMSRETSWIERGKRGNPAPQDPENA